MTERIAAEDAANDIWAAIESGGATGRTRDELLLDTGLTPSQFANGLGFLKDLLQEQRERPIAITKDHRYVLPENIVDSNDYLVSLMRGLHTRLTRTDHGTTAYVSKFKPLDGRLLEKSMQRLIEDLGDVLVLVDSGAN